jgi:hypothetical protein
MDDVPRHQCLIYRGEPTRQLAGLALLIRRMLEANYRCLYLNNEKMVAGIRSYLISSGLNVSDAVLQKRLILSSDRDHLINGTFDPRHMLDLLKQAFESALEDGHVGLWASGDMAWEFGPAKDFTKLVEYERGLEVFFQAHPTMRGVCQYHADFLPEHVVENGLIVHPGVYVNETLSRINPRYERQTG